MTADTLLSLVLILGTLAGLSRPLARRLPFGPPDQLLAGCVLSLVLVWGLGWGLYVAGAPASAWRLIPALAAAGLLADLGGVRRLLGDPDARQAAAGQLIVTGWCLSLLPFIRSYSGGGWAGDWFEHWERALFFIRHWPADHRFLGSYLLPARPPLANLVCAVFLAIPGAPDFPRYQAVMAILSSLAYLPAAAIARRLGGPRAPAVLTVLLAASPLFVANATFPWTKLPAAFLVLAGAYFLLPATAPDSRTRLASALIGAVALGAGLIAHYSAGPYLIVLGAVWIGRLIAHPADRTLQRAAVLAAAAGAAVLATWFCWAAAVYGPRALLTATTSVTQLHSWHGSQAAKILLNTRDTVVPPFLRSFDRSLLAQTNPWAAARDWFFLCYQLNLPLAFGSVGLLALVRELARAGRRARSREALAWTAGVAALIAIGCAVHGERSPWGLAHICLQPLVIGGLAFLASRWDGLGRGWRLALILGGAFDFAAGIVLPLAVQDYALGRAPGASDAATVLGYSWPAQANYLGKSLHGIEFMADRVSVSPGMGLALAAAILMLAFQQARAPLRPNPAP